jgi:hypothetical protein
MARRVKRRGTFHCVLTADLKVSIATGNLAFRLLYENEWRRINVVYICELVSSEEAVMII